MHAEVRIISSSNEYTLLDADDLFIDIGSNFKSTIKYLKSKYLFYAMRLKSWRNNSFEKNTTGWLYQRYYKSNHGNLINI